MKAVIYKDVLDENLVLEFIFQQNNDPKHMEETSKEWPNRSPDLSRTEHLWLDLKMAAQTSPVQPDGAGEER